MFCLSKNILIRKNGEICQHSRNISQTMFAWYSLSTNFTLTLSDTVDFETKLKLLLCVKTIFM